MEPGEESGSAREQLRQAAPRGADAARSVIRAETYPVDVGVSAGIAHVDWCAFTITPPRVELRWMAERLEELFAIPVEAWSPAKRGWQGYVERIDLGDRGLLAYGGETQKGSVHVELNATGCFYVPNWDAVRRWGEAHRATLTRVDLAHDDFAAEQLSISQALNWHRNGAFTTTGRPAHPHMRDDLGSNTGSTFYLGKREHGKLLRIYEKGKQLGDPQSPWCRAEVELRGKSRVIPWDVLTRPGCYLAGAYPCFSFLTAEQEKIKTIRKAERISYARMEQWLKTAAGRALNVMQQVHKGNAAAVLSRVTRDGAPKRLAGYPLNDPEALKDAEK